jgi:hypothetical protein
MATEKWIAGSGVGLTWTNAYTGTTLNSIASGNAILSDVQIDNSTALDVFADLSIALASAAFTASPFVGVYLYPLNKDGTTYGDGRFGTSAAGPPGASYYVGRIPLVAATQAQNGTLRRIVLPPGAFKFVLHNQGGIAFAATANTCQYRTYNRAVA